MQMKMLTDAFPQYKGELILGLKYVPPEVLPDKSIQVKGECQKLFLFIFFQVLLRGRGTYL